MSRRFAASAVVAAGLFALAGCSSGGGHPAAAGATSPPPASASPAPTGPNAALCAAARSLVAGAQPTFAADADADPLKQAGDDSAFYTQLSAVFSQNNGSDPVSVPVAADAEKLAQDYNAVLTALQNSDAGAATTAFGSVASDLQQLTTDQAAFDSACGIPAIVSS